MGEPIPYAPGGVKISVGVPAVVALPARTYRVRLVGLLYENDKTFLLPPAMHSIRTLKRFYDSHPGLQVLVNGHADRQGPADYNRSLSEERAKSMAAFLTDQVDAWASYYKPQQVGQAWGVREDQMMLATVTDGSAPFYPGAINGALNGPTKDAVKSFQIWANANQGTSLKTNGVPDAETRKALIARYMAQDETSLPAGTEVQTHGCGEFHPDQPTGDSVSEPKNRRVEVFLFEGGIQPAPVKPCPSPKGCKEYAVWSDATVESVDLDDMPGTLVVTASDDKGAPVEGADVHIAGTVSADGKTDGSGVAKIDTLPHGEYQLDVSKAGYKAFSGKVTVLTGAKAVDTPAPVTLTKLFVNLSFEPAKGSCGDKLRIKGTTDFPDGTEFVIHLKPRQGSSPNLAELTAKANGGKIDQEMEIKNVSFDNGAGGFLAKVELEATARAGDFTSETPAVLEVQALSDAPAADFDAHRTWSGFTNHSHFKQRIESFVNKVDVKFDIIKAWGGYWVDLTSFGVTGTAGGCPWAGRRWARVTGANDMAPDQYYDGSNWVAMPAGFSYTGTNYGAIAFWKHGTKFESTDGSGGTWPGAFADYDFNSAKYTTLRNTTWVNVTHDVWSRKFDIRRKDCHSEPKNKCCRYPLEVSLAFNTVASLVAEVIAVCPGKLRSNAANWFMDEPRVRVAAHESGHHMDNPDEYAGGAVDPTLNGDGAVNGIDADCIMGQNLTGVKKRHCHAFAEMVQKLIKAKYGRDSIYEAVPS
jgi:outer membrane protein OmpA-like peptidoglycan-associated protein